MESFDHSLKHLLQQEPEDFIRFGLRDATVTVLAPIPSDLPSRGRDVDGGYRISRGGDTAIAHVEFHRRHQRLEDLAVDVAEAQVRLYRRERSPVLSLVWDLYGNVRESLLEERTLAFGSVGIDLASRSVYVRVNLRALRAVDLLAMAPPALWPLVALTQDGASAEGVQRARDAIESRPDLPASQRADHLAVLWFVAEAEGVPTRTMMMYLSEEKLMESTLYKSIFEKGEIRGEARGEARGRIQSLSGMLIRVLTHRLGSVEPAVGDRIRATVDADVLEAWCEEAVVVTDAESARRLVARIMNSTPPAPNRNGE